MKTPEEGSLAFEGVEKPAQESIKEPETFS